VYTLTKGVNDKHRRQRLSGGEEMASVSRSLGRRGANSETDHLGGRFVFLNDKLWVPLFVTVISSVLLQSRRSYEKMGTLLPIVELSDVIEEV
jgi:hypothetical protein